MVVTEDLLAQIWASLEGTGVWVAPALADEVSPRERADLEAAVAAAPVPTYVVVQPLTERSFAGEPAELLTQLHDRYDADGLYLAPQFFGDDYDDLLIVDRAWGTDLDPWQAIAVAEARHSDGSDQVDDVGAFLVEAARLLGDDDLPELYDQEVASAFSSTSPGSPSSDGGSGGDAPAVGPLVAAGLGVLVVVAAVVALGRRRRGPAFTLPASVVAQVRAAHADRAEQDARSGLLELGDAIRTHDLDPGDDNAAWQAALDHYDGAARVLDTGGADLGLLDAVGALVLVRRGRAALTAATSGRSFRPAPVCYLHPLHGPPTRRRTRLVQDGHTGDVPLCADCRADLRAGRAPDALRVERDGRPVLYVDSGVEPWASTAYGALGADLMGALHRRTRPEGTGP